MKLVAVNILIMMASSSFDRFDQYILFHCKQLGSALLLYLDAVFQSLIAATENNNAKAPMQITGT
jgi:hypothetical protein